MHVQAYAIQVASPLLNSPHIVQLEWLNHGTYHYMHVITLCWLLTGVVNMYHTILA